MQVGGTTKRKAKSFGSKGKGERKRILGTGKMRKRERRETGSQTKLEMLLNLCLREWGPKVGGAIFVPCESTKHVNMVVLLEAHIIESG